MQLDTEQSDRLHQLFGDLKKHNPTVATKEDIVKSVKAENKVDTFKYKNRKNKDFFKQMRENKNPTYFAPIADLQPQDDISEAVTRPEIEPLTQEELIEIGKEVAEEEWSDANPDKLDLQ